MSSIPGSGRSPGEGHGNPLQYSCLENSMGRETWRATDSNMTEEAQHACMQLCALHFTQLGFPGGSASKEPSCNAGRYPRRGHGNPLQYFCLEKLHGQRNLAGYSPQGHKELDTTEPVSTAQHSTVVYINILCVLCVLVAQSCPTLKPRGLQPTGLLCPWDFPGKNTRVGCHFLLQGIFPTQVLNLGSPALQADSLLSEPPGKSLIHWVQIFLKYIFNI